MNVGKLDKRITLQRPNLVADGAGGWKPGPGGKWIDVATVWAEFKNPDFETREVAGAVASVSRREVKIRYRTDVKKGWRALHGSDIMPIDHVYNIGRAETFLVVKEVVK